MLPTLSAWVSIGSIVPLHTSFKTNKDLATTFHPRYDGAKHHHTSRAVEPTEKPCCFGIRWPLQMLLPSQNTTTSCCGDCMVLKMRIKWTYSDSCDLRAFLKATKRPSIGWLSQQRSYIVIHPIPNTLRYCLIYHCSIADNGQNSIFDLAHNFLCYNSISIC